MMNETHDTQTKSLVRMVQNDLSTLYQVPITHDACEFLSISHPSNPHMIKTNNGQASRDEVLYIQEDGADIALRLYLSAELQSQALHTAHIDARAKLIEGVSHLVYIIYRAGIERPVSHLELELQAEVDKYALAMFADVLDSKTSSTHMLEGFGVHLIKKQPSHAWVEYSTRVRHTLFNTPHYIDAEGTENYQRYRDANHMAAQWCIHLESMIRRDKLEQCRDSLRAFYHSNLEQKIRLCSQPL